jgi:hypothetical protein
MKSCLVGSVLCIRVSDWVIEAVVDLDATDEAGEAVVLTTAMRRL